MVYAKVCDRLQKVLKLNKKQLQAAMGFESCSQRTVCTNGLETTSSPLMLAPLTILQLDKPIPLGIPWFPG